MIRKQEATGKTVDEARAKACALLGVQADDLNVSYEVLEMPQKTGFLGLKTTPAKVCVSVEEPDAPAAPAAAPAPAAEAAPEVPAAPWKNLPHRWKHRLPRLSSLPQSRPPRLLPQPQTRRPRSPS